MNKTCSFSEEKARRDFLPFGDELYAGIGSRNTAQKYSSNADDTRKKFATYQRDIETGLDFAQSRYYSPMLGRFTSPDEFKGGPDELFDFEEDASDNPTFYADLENPQSLNKYQYRYNSPYKYNDPTGHCPPCIGQTMPLPMPWWIPKPVVVPKPIVGPVPPMPITGPITPSVTADPEIEAIQKMVPPVDVPSLPNARIPDDAPQKGQNSNSGREGKRFTPKGKREVKERNRADNGGKNRCENCGVTTTKPTRTRGGQSRPKRETQIDHIIPRSKGGKGTPDNGQVLCRTCNQKKGTKLPSPKLKSDELQ